MDYSSPETGKTLEAIFTDRFGAEELKTVKADVKAVEDKSRKEPAPGSEKAGAESEPEDPGELAKILFARLADAEPVGDSELAGLADARALAIVSELTEAGKIAAKRLQVKPSVKLDKGDAVTAALTLEPLR